MYQTTYITPPLRKEHMSTLTPPVTALSAPNLPCILTPAIIILAGAELRRIVGAEPAAPFARAPRRFGDLTVELVRAHNLWRLYLADLSPIQHTICDRWATAVSAPSVDWQRTTDGCLCGASGRSRLDEPRRLYPPLPARKPMRLQRHSARAPRLRRCGARATRRSGTDSPAEY